MQAMKLMSSTYFPFGLSQGNFPGFSVFFFVTFVSMFFSPFPFRLLSLFIRSRK